MQYTVERDASDPYEGVAREEPKVVLSVTHDELLLIVNAVGHTVSNIEDWEFGAILGVSRDDALQVHDVLGAAFDELKA